MKSVIAALAIFFALPAYAFKVPAQPSAGLSMSLGNWTTASNFTGTFNSAGATAATLSASVAGTAVSMSGTASLAANAAAVATAAWRLTPVGIIGPLGLAWLMEYGLSRSASGAWEKTVTPEDGFLWSADNSQNFYPTRQAACDAQIPKCNSPGHAGVSCTVTYIADFSNYYWQVKEASGSGCLSGAFSRRNGTATTQAATAADWAAPSAATLPPDVATETAPKVPLPLQAPKTDAPYKDIAIGQPYIDPVTGKRYQDMIRITPSADGKSFDVQSFKQEVNADGTPATNPTTGTQQAPEKAESQTDCDKFPDSIGCSDWGEPEDIDMQKDTRNITITPDSGWLTNGTCPADKSYTLHGGRTLTFSYAPICTAAGWLRPVVIGLGWLTAVLTFMGISRRVQG